MSRRDAPTSRSNDKDQSSTITKNSITHLEQHRSFESHPVQPFLPLQLRSEAARTSVLSKLVKYVPDLILQAISYAKKNSTDPIKEDDSDFIPSLTLSCW